MRHNQSRLLGKHFSVLFLPLTYRLMGFWEATLSRARSVSVATFSPASRIAATSSRQDHSLSTLASIVAAKRRVSRVVARRLDPVTTQAAGWCIGEQAAWPCDKR